MAILFKTDFVIILHMTPLHQAPKRKIKEKNSIIFEVIRHITLYYFTVAIVLTLAQIVLEYFQIKRISSIKLKTLLPVPTNPSQIRYGNLIACKQKPLFKASEKTPLYCMSR